MFVIELKQAAPAAILDVECNKIDLVVHWQEHIAFIEFKYYVHSSVLDPYTRFARGKKSHPSPANFRQFKRSVSALQERPAHPNLARFVVLFYADPADQKLSARYAAYYSPPNRLGITGLGLIASVPEFACSTSGHLCNAALFEVDA